MLKIVLAQLNFCAGDIDGNAEKIIHAIQLAESTHKADLIVFPELALTGYPPEDLLLRDDFFEKIHESIERIKPHSDNIIVLLGAPHRTNKGVYNAALMFHQRKIIAQYYKQCLPNYGVFDEKRYFIPGSQPCVIELGGMKVGITICEDLWEHEPASQLEKQKVNLIISLNASPFENNKSLKRYEVLRARQKETGVPIVYVNLVGGQDELVFDGGSFALDKSGEKATQLPFFKESLGLIEFDEHAVPQKQNNILPVPDETQLIYEALVLSLRDYVKKNNFKRVLLGLSGGIDSALTLTIAVDALGAEYVHAVMLPSTYTSSLSLTEAQAQARLLGVKYTVLSIETLHQDSAQLLEKTLGTKIKPITNQNIQSRCRMMLLMAISNDSDALLLSTTNKSELAIGYGTLYGDMAGAYAILKDVYKTTIYDLVMYRNKISHAIPEAVIKREPTAELAPNQLDQDTLPPYSILDEILKRYIEKNQSLRDLVFGKFEKSDVEKVIQMVKNSEYKRRQAPPGPKITPCAFGRERRYPITSGFDSTIPIKK